MPLPAAGKRNPPLDGRLVAQAPLPLMSPFFQMMFPTVLFPISATFQKLATTSYRAILSGFHVEGAKTPGVNMAVPLGAIPIRKYAVALFGLVTV